MTFKDCFICNNSDLHLKNNYQVCSKCFHEEQVNSMKQEFIVNDHLDLEEVMRLSGLDRFKLHTISKLPYKTEGTFIDIGSASGKFIYHSKGYFKHILGLEITKECVEFSREKLNLNIIESIYEHQGEIHGAFAFHSLEHFPTSKLKETVKNLKLKFVSGGHFVVSVPNASSYQYKLFGKAFAYYDFPAHTQQFSYNSLTQFMKNYGFTEKKLFVSHQYNCFSLSQSLLNLLNRKHNYLYYRLKRKANSNINIFDDLWNLLILPFAVILGYSLGLLEGLVKSKQSVITAIYEKI